MYWCNVYNIIMLLYNTIMLTLLSSGDQGLIHSCVTPPLLYHTLVAVVSTKHWGQRVDPATKAVVSTAICSIPFDTPVTLLTL